MIGNNTHVIITERDYRLFEVLAVLGVLLGAQIKIMWGGERISARTVNERLFKLLAANLLKRWFLGTDAGGRKAVYGLTEKSAALIGSKLSPLARRSDSLLVADFFVQHKLLVAELWLAFRYSLPQQALFRRWQGFRSPLLSFLPLVPDGYVELESDQGVLAMFLEADRGTESQTVFGKKVRLYLEFARSGEFERLFAQKKFRVLIVSESERRLEPLRRTTAKITEKLFFFTTTECIKREGILSAIWWRPSGEERHSLAKPL